MPLPRRAAAVLAAGVLLLATGCTGDDEEPEPQALTSRASTPLTSYAADTVVLERAPFCEQIPTSAVDEALGGEATRSTAWDNGERTRLTDDVRDVAHEYGCSFEGEEATARAWLFAPPVTPARARELIRQASRVQGCRAEPGDPGFGQRSVAMVCETDGEQTASYRGLFGDAWLSCSIAVPTGSVDVPELMDRTGRWCVQAAEAARASGG
jgi:hypothetical protein